ncbi:hypothetical protein EW145_g3807, partial [Phellinidium pouzarii]
MSLTFLPSELYSAILGHVDADHVQRTTLALTRVLPHAPIPLEYLFAHVCLRQPQQVVQLHRRLRTSRADARYVRVLRLESWTADAQVVINLLALLDCLVSLTLFVGTNFAPEDLLEVFQRPRERLQCLSLRFRPYHFLRSPEPPVATQITSLRLRTPARDVTPYIAAAPLAFPVLTALDLSTGNIKAAQLARLLTRFARVR